MRKIYNDPQQTNQLFNQDDNRATKEDINQLSVRIDETVQALDNLAANLASYKEEMAANVDTNQLNAVSAAIQTLASTTAQISNLTVANQEVTVKAIIESLESNLADIKSLISESADVVSLLADSATIDEATITTLNATTANIANWVLQNISAQSIIANSATFGSASIGGLRVDGNSIIVGNQSVGGNLTVTGDATADNITADSIATAEASVENMHWNGSTVITNTPESFIVAIPHFENGQYYVQLVNEDSSYATIEIFNSVDNYFVRWSQPNPGIISNIYKDGVNENAVIYVEIENPDELSLTIKYASTCATENVQGPATYTEMPVEPLVVYPVTYKDGSKFFKNVDLAQQGSTVGTLRQLDSTNIEDATDNIAYDTTEDATIIVYKPDQQLNTTDDVSFHEVDTTFLGVRDFHTRNFIATEMKTLSTIDLTKFDDGSIIVVRIGSTSETNMPSAAYIKETINGSPVLFDIVKTRNMPIVASNKPLIWDPTTKSIIEATDVSVAGELDVGTDVKIGNDLFVDNNVVISGDLEVRGTTFSSEVENVQADGDWIVLRANNPNSLANGSYAGFVFHNYNSLGKDAAITVDNTGTFRVSTQTTESVSPLANTWLVDEQYFYDNVDFSQATLLDENYPVTRFAEVFTDIEAYKDSNDDHYFFDPKADTIEYHDNVVYNTVTQKVELSGNIVSFTPDPSVDTPHEVHFYTSISFMEPQASDMEAIATRDETSEWDDNEIPMYDTTAEKFVGIGAMPNMNGQVLTAQVDGTTGAVSYTWKAGGGAGGLAFVGTRAQYEVARLIPEGTDGYIPSGAMVVITDENDYIEGEEQ